MAIAVTCITKSNGYHEDPHHAISTLGWYNDQTMDRGNSTREQMWEFLTRGGVVYVKDSYGNVAYVYPHTSRNGTRYVQTAADGKLTDNLLSLPECG